MGADNADNSFDSSNVTANADGSIIERLEDLEERVNSDYTTCSTVFSHNVPGNTTIRPDCPTNLYQ